MDKSSEEFKLIRERIIKKVSEIPQSNLIIVNNKFISDLNKRNTKDTIEITETDELFNFIRDNIKEIYTGDPVETNKRLYILAKSTIKNIS